MLAEVVQIFAYGELVSELKFDIGSSCLLTYFFVGYNWFVCHLVHLLGPQHEFTSMIIYTHATTSPDDLMR